MTPSSHVQVARGFLREERNLGTGAVYSRVRMRCVMPGSDDVIHIDPEILGGTPVFVGTRVPLRNLIDYLEGGHDLEEFLDDFPTVRREQAIAALEAAHEALTRRARSAG
jgi:uncharacterized protein (DUF433 family)